MKFRRNDRVSYGYAITLLSVYYTLFQNVNDYALNVLDTLSSINTTIKVRKLRYFINPFLLPLIMISSIRHSSIVRRVFENIDSFDKEVKYLNTEIDHVACVRNDVVQIATASFVVILLNLMDYYALLDSDRTYMYVIMWILDRVPDFVNTVTICSFASLINKIRFRFEAINSIEHIITNGKTLDSLTESSDVNNGRLVVIFTNFSNENKLLRLPFSLQIEINKTAATKVVQNGVASKRGVWISVHDLIDTIHRLRLSAHVYRLCREPGIHNRYRTKLSMGYHGCNKVHLYNSFIPRANYAGNSFNIIE